MVPISIFFLLITLPIEVFCESETNNSTVSRREIMEQQALTAYQNACYRLQELSNWMTAVFRIKSVWAIATVNEISARTDRFTESDQRIKSVLPPRLKTTGNECSLGSVQVTAQTYVFLQSQLVLMKWLLGRNLFKSSKEKLEGANTSLKERMKMLDAFNTTLNDVVFKLRENTANTSTSIDSEALTARNLNDVPKNSLFQILQVPKTLLMSMLGTEVIQNQTQDETDPKRFFQNLGRNLDKLIFPVTPIKLNSSTEYSVSASTADVLVMNLSKTDVPTFTLPKTDVSMTNLSVKDVPKKKASTSNAVMFSNIF